MMPMKNSIRAAQFCGLAMLCGALLCTPAVARSRFTREEIAAATCMRKALASEPLVSNLTLVTVKGPYDGRPIRRLHFLLSHSPKEIGIFDIIRNYNPSNLIWDPPHPIYFIDRSKFMVDLVNIRNRVSAKCPSIPEWVPSAP